VSNNLSNNGSEDTEGARSMMSTILGLPNYRNPQNPLSNSGNPCRNSPASDDMYEIHQKG